MDASLGKIPTTSARRFTSCSGARSGSYCEAWSGAGGKGHVGQHVVLAGVHQVGQLWPARGQLLGHLAPSFAGMGAVGLIEGLPDRGRDDGVLTSGDMSEGVPHPMHAGAVEKAFSS